MGLPSFIHDNLIPAAAISSSTQAPATVEVPVKRGEGSATMRASGSYTGDLDNNLFTVEIDGVGAGKSVGQATYKWKRETDAAWQATGVTTSAAAAALTDGVSVRFIAGAGDDFELGDRFTFRAIRFFGRLRLSDRDPNTEWRTGALVGQEYIAADFGASKALDTIVIHGHNLTSAAAITLKGHSGADPDPVIENMQILVDDVNDKILNLFADDGAFSQAWPSGVSGNRYTYIGATATFGQISVVDMVLAAVYTGAGTMALTVEYWNGAAWAALAVVDGTAVGGDTFQQAGNITYTAPGGWAAVNAGDLIEANFPRTAWAYARAGLYYLRFSLTPSAGKVVTSAGSADQVVPQGLTAPDFTEAITWRAGTIVHRTATPRTARSIRIEIVDASNPDGHIRIVEWLVCAETVLSSLVHLRGLERLRRPGSRIPASESQARRVLAYAPREAILLKVLLDQTDYATLRAIHSAVYSLSSMRVFPFFLDVDKDQNGADDVFLVAFDGPLKETGYKGMGSSAVHTVDVRLRELPLVRAA